MGLFVMFLVVPLFMACSPPPVLTAVPATRLPTRPPIPKPNGLESVTESARLAVRAVTSSGAKRVGILDIGGLGGNRTMLGRFLAEEITTAVQKIQTVTIVERRLIDEMMSEGRFSGTGLIDDATAAELGGKLGADAVLTGTLTEFGDELRFNMRIIMTKDGKVSAAEQATLTLDEPLRKLWTQEVRPIATPARTPGVPTGSSPSLSDSGGGSQADAFYEDFTSVPEGELPNGWVDGTDLMVKPSGKLKGRKVLVPFKGGNHSFLIPKIPFPNDFTLEIEMINNLHCCEAIRVDVGNLSFGLHTNGDSWFGPHSFRLREDDSWSWINRVILVTLSKEGSVFRLSIDGQQIAMIREELVTPPSSLRFSYPKALEFGIYKIRVYGS